MCLLNQINQTKQIELTESRFIRGGIFLYHFSMKKVAIQGTLGSYHDIAAHQYFAGEEITLVCCSHFKDIFNALKSDSSTIGMLAIENTIAGSLLQNHNLVKESNVRIVGEYKLRISHCLVCLPEEDWEDIKEVNSHPIALMQCREFLESHPDWKIVEGEDTARSAELISTQKLSGHAAICSKAAAELYGMKILKEGIETNKHNFTRFLVVADAWKSEELLGAKSVTNKSSIVFSLPHTEGSLSQVLSILSFYKMNLTKIQSLPIIGREWEYQFYVDLTFENDLRYHQALDAIHPLTKELKILGEYAEGQSSVQY